MCFEFDSLENHLFPAPQGGIATYREFVSLEDTSEWGKRIWGAWAKNYKDAMERANCVLRSSKHTFKLYEAFECYLGYTYQRLNNYLRTSPDYDADLRYSAEFMHFLIYTAPRIPENIVVYRLVSDKFADEMMMNIEKGICVRENAFISASLLSTIVNSDEPYANHKNLLKIYVRADTAGIYASTIAERNETELLFPLNKCLGLIKEPYQKTYYGKVKTVYECNLIDY